MQVNNHNKNLGFAALTIDPKIWEKGSVALKEGLVQSLPEIEKHSKHCDVFISLCHPGGFGMKIKRGKHIGQKIFFKPHIQGEGAMENYTEPTKENIVWTLNNILTECRFRLRQNLEKKFGTKAERALKDPEKHLAKVAKREQHSQKIKGLYGITH